MRVYEVQFRIIKTQIEVLRFILVVPEDQDVTATLVQEHYRAGLEPIQVGFEEDEEFWLDWAVSRGTTPG